MHFRYLDGGPGLEGAFTIGYRITDDAGELWTSRFNRFKAKNMEAFAGGLKMMREGMPGLVTALGIDPDKTVFVAALGSGETQARSDGQIPVLTRGCAEAVGAKFELNALSKQVHKPIHEIFNAAEREAELEKAAYTAGKLPADNVFIFDDTHEETGRKAIYVNRLMTVGIVDMPQAESAPLLNAVFDHAEKREFVYEHVWRVGDLLLWDNRCSSHARTDFASTERRLMLRTTVKGTARPY
jgi:Taurine catabolism dioxygenase TauD, TfdA family